MQLFEHVKEVLSKNESFCKDGKLFKNNVVEAALKMDAELLTILLKDDTTKKHFFTTVEGVQVFDKLKFQQFVSNKQFLPDSYTTFKNKIGLTANGDYLTEANEVVLDFPYKDCVLEGGQTKEDQKRKEIFWNETLASDEVDRLFEPKVLTNWKKYDSKGEQVPSSVSDKDNLIIKGNNLLSLHSLEPFYKGQIKLIYIDPPYNTGSDSFNYNDRFNHSSWLTFMKNRLRIARRLLAKDGAIFIQIDHHQLGYLVVLMDEIFGIENKVQVISAKTASPAGFKTVNPGPIDVTEYILFYTRNKSNFNFKKGYVPVGYNKNYNLYLEKDDNVKKWKFIPIKEKILEELSFKSEKEAKKQYGNLWKSIYPVILSDFAFDNANNVVSIRDPHKPTDTVQELMDKSREVDYPIEHKREDGSSIYLYNGGSLAFYSNKKRKLDGKDEITELLTDFWSHISWAGIAKEGGVKLKNGKKPEKLLKQIIELTTEPGDIVLDYHLGSGTTAAVAHKMNRRYIGLEQLDYGKNDAVKRLINVINGDQSGVSKGVEWKDGGSFVYVELTENAANYISRIEALKDSKEAVSLWNQLKEEPFISYRVSPVEFDASIHSFEQLELDDQKKLLISTIDKNHLYINFADIEDKTYNISDADKKLNFQFYNR